MWGKRFAVLFMLGMLLVSAGCTGGQPAGEKTKETLSAGFRLGKALESEIESGNSLKDMQKAEEAEAGTQPIEAAERSPEDCYQSILDGCTKGFIGGYRIDEAFLMWLTSAFGEDVIYRLEAAVARGNQDSGLWYELTGNSIHVLWDTYCQASGFQNDSLDKVYWKECTTAEQTVIDFTGDINFAEDWSTTIYMDKQIDGLYDCLGSSLMKELNQADILMVNNEFTYSRRGEPLEGKAYTFRADPDRVHLLDIMGADIVSLGNNHTYDYGEEALLDTLTTLEEAGVPYVGAGRNLKEAMEPGYFIANGRKIAFVAATQIERSYTYTKEAGPDSPGVLKTLNPDKFLTVIGEARKKADYVIVFVHWGTEGSSQFDESQEALSRAYVEAGADVIIGGHTHCLQGCAYYDGVPVIYSLGNFWFSSTKVDTGISQLIIEQDGSLKFRFLPCIQKNSVTTLVEGSEKQRILDDMTSISQGVFIDENGYIVPEG